MNGNLEKEKKKIEKRVRREKEEERTRKGQCASMLKIFNNFISQLSVSFEYIEHNIFLISNNIYSKTIDKYTGSILAEVIH